MKFTTTIHDSTYAVVAEYVMVSYQCKTPIAVYIHIVCWWVYRYVNTRYGFSPYFGNHFLPYFVIPILELNPSWQK